MFPARAFAPRYYAPRYWVKAGADGIVFGVLGVTSATDLDGANTVSDLRPVGTVVYLDGANTVDEVIE